jgi:MFS family permease
VLRNRNFQRLFAARIISNIGNGIAPIALAFGVLELPGATPTSLSIVLAVQAIPVILLLPVGGVIADRLGRARVIAVSDVLLSGFVAAIAILFITGNATVPLIAALGAVGGALNAVWWPAFTGLVPDVMDEEHLQPANAFVSFASNGGLILGNALGGILVALVGPGLAIAVDALSFLVAGLLVFSFRHVSKPHESGEGMLGDLAHGWRVFVSYRWVVVTVACFSLVVMALRGAEEVLGPVLAKQSYGGPAGWALVLSMVSAGLLVGAFIASRVRPKRPLLFATTLSFTLPIWLLLLAIAAPLPVIAVASFAWGLAFEIFGVLWFTTMQQNVPRESLSRVSSYDAMGSLMFGPIGLALAGPLAGAVGLETAFFIAAGISGAALVVALCFPSIRNLRAIPSAT